MDTGKHIFQVAHQPPVSAALLLWLHRPSDNHHKIHSLYDTLSCAQCNTSGAWCNMDICYGSLRLSG